MRVFVPEFSGFEGLLLLWMSSFIINNDDKR